MERFLGALSITLLLSGWAAVTQFQNAQAPMAQVVQTDLSQPRSAAPSEALLDRSGLTAILARALRFDPSRADRLLFARSDDPIGSDHFSRQASGVSLQSRSPFSEAYDDIQVVLHNNVPHYQQGHIYLDQTVTHARAFSLFTQP